VSCQGGREFVGEWGHDGWMRQPLCPCAKSKVGPLGAVVRMPHFSHFILTVFNVRVAYGGDKPPDRTWLDHRFRLFDSFCYPSVRAQGCQDFTWLVLFDAATPTEYRKKIEKYQEWDRFVPVYVDEVMSVEAFARMKDRVIGDRAGSPEILVTTQLDNDDALHRTYIERIQSEVKGEAFEFINASNGYVLDYERNRLYRKRDLSNPFVSLIEPFRDFKTVWCGPHPKLSTFGPIRQIETEPLWLQVVHGKNISNNVGIRRRLPRMLIKEGFTTRHDRLGESESPTEILMENVLHALRLVPEKLGWKGR
jgi:hypothetical protein